LRSGTYVSFWRPAGVRSATVRVLHEHQGQRKVVSHFNKATKGRIVRALMESGADPRTPSGLAGALRDLGWVVEEDGERLDVVVSEL
ncbi:MAG: peroxide stress protein YaaA, partial [Nocardioides sp.]